VTKERRIISIKQIVETQLSVEFSAFVVRDYEDRCIKYKMGTDPLKEGDLLLIETGHDNKIWRVVMRA
jgi:hypothetical protein